MKYYLYRHIRPDLNKPFYIGKGTKKNRNFRVITSEFSRAYSKDNRTFHWHNIYKLNNKNIEVEIIYESNDHDEICRKETEFIALYGREDLEEGTLINLTNGGEGIPGRIKTAEEIEKSASKHRGKQHTPEHRKKISDANKGENNAFFGKKHTKKTKKQMSRSGKLKVITPVHEKNLKEGHSRYFKEHPEFGQDRCKPVIQMNLNGDFIAEHRSIKAAAKAIGVKSAEAIGAVCQGRTKTSNGYKWKFKEL